jgi:RHS repeat-associated protein
MFRSCRAIFTALTFALSFAAIAANLPPIVSITSPASGLTFTAPASITLAATASDSDGTIASVKFYRGTTLLGTDATSPYSFAWTNVAAGTYSITATATDNIGAITTSSAVTVTVAANVAPTVSISSPTAGTTFTAPAAITINANAADVNNGTITKIDFYRGTTLLGTDTTAPYSYAWTNAAAGSYSITAKATDNSGAVTTSAAVAITVAANVAPTVSITSPAAGTSFTAPAAITINANAADINSGTITKVDFYNGTTLLGSDTTSPYSFSWANVAAGSYSITAKATDNSGAVTTSSAIAVTVIAANTPPTVSISSPVTGASFVAPAAVTINAIAADNNGAVTKVDFYNGTTLLGSDTTSPYSFAWANVAAGSYSITAKATDNVGAVTTSTAVAITVSAPNASPTVNISSPAASSVFTAPAAITINATAADSDGTVSKVDFYNGTTLLGSDATSPYSFAWTNVAAGSYSITAKATDNSGAVTTSSAIAVTVAAANTPPTVSITSPATGTSFNAPAVITINATAADSNGTVSKVDFYNGATLLGTYTSAPYSFAWTNVAAGSYSITAKATDNAGAVTTSSAIAVTVNAVNPGLTVNLTSPASGSSYTAPATITLNAAANNLNGTISKIDFYNGASSLCSVVLSTPSSNATATCTWSGVAVGIYSITVKVTDSLGAVTTTGVTTITVQSTNVAPTVSLTSPISGASFSAPATITLNATAADNNGTVTKVDFYNGTTLLGTDTTSPYSFTWANVAAGSYSITAKATDNAGSVTTTSAATITVTAVNVPPTVSLANTLNGAVFTAPAAITLNATASDSDGTISKVDFYEGTNLLGSDTTSPFSFVWSNAPAGSYNITAKATDNRGAVSTSSVSNINVLPANPGLLINFISPEDGERYTAPATIPLRIATSNSNGVISKVEFYSGTSLLCSIDMGSQYSVSWATCTLSGRPVGSYNMSAKTYDELGVSTSTPVINVIVQSTNVPPKIILTSPLSIDAFVAPANITLNADASDNNGTVTKVDFYNGTTLLGTSTTAPYSFDWNNVAIGSYNITAKATDNAGATTTTAVTGISVLPVNILPTVSLTNPAPGTVFPTNGTINLNAAAADSDGTISKVDFYADWGLLGTVTAAPYNFTWNNAPAGSYNLSAQVTDNRGAVITSAIVPVTVGSNTPLTATITSPNNGASFTSSSMIDIVGFINRNDSIRTIAAVNFNYTTSFGTDSLCSYVVDPPQSNSNSLYLTCRWSWIPAGDFSITVSVTDSTGFVSTSAPINITIKPVTYPNIEITSPLQSSKHRAPATINITANASDVADVITKVEFYNGTTLLGTDTTAPYSFTWTNVPVGDYQIVVYATDSAGTRDGRYITISVVDNQAPTVSITSPTASATFTTPAAITINASAADTDGSVTKVDFYKDATLLGTATSAPYSFVWTNVPIGSYNLTAIATDNEGAITISTIMSVTVAVPIIPPVISITSPVNNARFATAPANIPITVNASDPDGTVTKVEYYNGSVLIGTATTAPFSFTWNSVPNGRYFIRAKATDNVGATTTSASIKVIVGDGETITYIHNDFAGSPLAATDAAGNIIWKENYRPFGERLTNQAESTDNRLGFHGKAVDTDTGLQYFGARYYDPVLGRFMGVDPVGFQDDNIHSFNKYAYGNNNPYKYIDPDGKNAVSVILILGAGMVSGALTSAGVNMAMQYMDTGNINWRSVGMAASEGAELGMLLGPFAAGAVGRSPTARLSQDINVNPVPPAALPLAGRVVGNTPSQNTLVQNQVQQMKASGYTDIRIDQQQVNASGVRCGICRPDVQGTNPSGRREYYEYDRSSSKRGPAHAQRLKANDPSGSVTQITAD